MPESLEAYALADYIYATCKGSRAKLGIDYAPPPSPEHQHGRVTLPSGPLIMHGELNGVRFHQVLARAVTSRGVRYIFSTSELNSEDLCRRCFIRPNSPTAFIPLLENSLFMGLIRTAIRDGRLEDLGSETQAS